ncbi:30S ribosomal protein S1 [Anabaena sp. FACHB-1237]|uniref:S1 RNA-binding domain-containing protein n=1 Tax=Anabaena sp. FACHB-1237 TaxID=2692769 RepID=UPI001680CF8B|nr:S1 RNA-binding domain-containing protein [Anabaena sp. FACHB-1237]MBD2137117.1 30S ribosomal protein S1 [Anabaena sp. FACHB-1237]
MTSESKSSQTANSSFSMDDFAKALETHDYQFQKGQIVHGKVFQFDHDGAYVDIGGKSSAFLPRDEASLRVVTNLADVLPMNEELQFLIIRDQDAEGQVTLSRKQLEIQHIWDKLTQMKENSQTVEAKITGANKGGVTVDVLSLRGFIPRSQLTERDNLEALKGQTIVAGFLEVNRETKKLILSQKVIARSSNFSLLEVGQLVEGKITGIKPFGVFVELDGISALLHIKQVSQKFIESLDKVFQIGQEIKAIIIDLDEGKNRVAISTRVLENFPGEMLENMVEVMNSAEARAKRAANKSIDD